MTKLKEAHSFSNSTQGTLTPQQELFKLRQAKTLAEVKNATSKEFDAFSIIIDIASNPDEKATDRLAACKLYINSTHAKQPLEQKIEFPSDPESYSVDRRPELAKMLADLFERQGMTTTKAAHLAGTTPEAVRSFSAQEAPLLKEELNMEMSLEEAQRPQLTGSSYYQTY